MSTIETTARPSMIDATREEMDRIVTAIEEMVRMYALLENVGEERSVVWDRLVAAMDEQGIDWESFGGFAEELFQREWPEGY